MSTVPQPNPKVWVILHAPSAKFLTHDGTLTRDIGPAVCWYTEREASLRHARIEKASRAEYRVVQCEMSTCTDRSPTPSGARYDA